MPPEGFEPSPHPSKGSVCKLLLLGTDTQSVQRESNPHIYHGKVAGGRYIMDAGTEASSGGWS